MSEPIISPWLFYLMDIVDNVKGALFFLTLVCTIVIAFYPLWSDGLEKERCRKILQRFCLAFLITGILNVLTPTSNTVIKILVAQHVTPANIQIVGESVDKTIDRVIEKISSYKEKTK